MLFAVAEVLHLPVYWLEENLPVEELYEWEEWFKLKKKILDKDNGS
jgi:hypothetical protein